MDSELKDLPVGGGTSPVLLIVVGILGIAIGAVATWFSADRSRPDPGLYGRGLNEIKNKNPDAAIKDFSKLLEENPADSASRFGLAWAYQTKGWPDPAAKQYDQAAAAATDTFLFSNYNAGVIYGNKGKWNDAIAAYQRVLAVNPKFESALYNTGHAYLQIGQNDLAMKYFLETIQINPRNAAAHFNCGTAAERLGKKDDAKKQYRDTAALDAGFPGLKEKLATLK